MAGQCTDVPGKKFEGNTLNELVLFYQLNVLPEHPGSNIQDCGFDACFDAALDMRWCGMEVMDRHQCNLKRTSRKDYADCLRGEQMRIQSCKTFEEVHAITAVCRCGGIGDLTVYDTALRMSLRRGMVPQEVHLHRGAFDGARALEERGFVNPGTFRNDTSYPVGVFPEDIRMLKAWEIENFLCCCAGEIRKLEK